MTDFETDLQQSERAMRRLMYGFGATLVMLVGGLGGWAMTSEIESAVVANGKFVVKSNGQAVQHLQGGVVGQILVSEGDRVKKDQVIMMLDAAQVHAELGILKKRLVELTAERARLTAERDGMASIPTPGENGGKIDPELVIALGQQQSLLEARRTALESQLLQLNEQRRQTESQIEGSRRIKAARNEELEQGQDDLDGMIELDRKRLIRRTVLRQTRRQLSRLTGDIFEITSRLDGLSSRLNELNFKIREIQRKWRSEMLDRLQTVQRAVGETLEKHTAAVDRMKRLAIRAPSCGIVHEVEALTVGGVIAPGQVVMKNIPDNEPLELHARIRTSERDQVQLGQKATARITALDNTVSPELTGEVATVAADRSEDERTGIAYFTVKIALDPDQDHKLGNKRLTPGLPADVFIKGESRLVITYLTQPLMDQIAHTFREE